jgi:hypothetical protein
LYRCRSAIAVGYQHYLAVAAPGKGGGIFFRIGKGPGNIRQRVQRIHQEHPADDGFHFPPAFNTAGNFHFWLIGKGNKVEGIPQTEEFLQKRAGYIVSYFPVITAHA